MERDLKKELERGREWKRVMKGKLLIPSSEFCVLMIPLHVALIPSIITSISSPPSLYTHPSLQFPFYPSPSFPPSHPYYFPSIPHPQSQIFPLCHFLPSYSISLPIHTISPSLSTLLFASYPYSSEFPIFSHTFFFSPICLWFWTCVSHARDQITIHISSYLSLIPMFHVTKLL